MLNGLLILDKPLRMSSAQAVAIVKRRASAGAGGSTGRGSGGLKVGHAGTLDPLATGVLVIAVGAATKSVDRLMGQPKRYRTHIDLSAFTTTDDAEGERERITPRGIPTADEIRAALAARFTGEIMQTPPAYSAVKVGGRRAYAMARGGEMPEIAPRLLMVHAIALVSYAWPIAEIDIHCGKGFYVRALARDLGKALGTGGFCVSIRRTAVGPYTLEMARTVEQLPQSITQDDLIPVAA